MSRGFSVASDMRRECFPDVTTGIDRVLDTHTPTRDTCILTLVRAERWPASNKAPLNAAWMVSHRGVLR